MGDFTHFIRRGALVVAASALLLATGAAQGPAPSRAAIDRAISQIGPDCGGKVELSDGFESRTEINGDGIEDVVLNFGALSCEPPGMEPMVSFYCGSAGCVHQIFISTPRGYVAGYNGNIHEWSVDRARTPPHLLLTMHGSACGQVGADVCRKALAWNGSRLVDAASVRAAVQAAASAPIRAAARPATWQAVQDARGYRIARTDGAAPVTGVALTCEGRTPYLAVHLTPSPRARTAMLAVSADGRSANVRLANIGRNQTWAAQVGGNGVVDLLASGADHAALTLDGRAAGSLDLAGAREAIGAALAGCHAMRPPSVAAAPAPAARPAAGLSLPIRQGHYVMTSESCADPSSVTQFDGNRVRFLSRDPSNSHSETIAKIDRAGAAHEVEFVRPPDYEEDELTGADNYMAVDVLSETRIRVTIQDDSEKRFCPAESLPAVFRNQ